MPSRNVSIVLTGTNASALKAISGVETAAAKAGTGAASSLGSASSKIGRSFNALDAQLASFGVPFAGSIGRVGSTLESLQGKTKSFGSTLADLGKAEALVAVVGLAAVGSEAVHLADDLETAHAREVTSIKNAGASYGQYADAISKTDSQLEKFGFTNADTESSIANLTNATHDVGKSIDLEGLAANIARGRHIDLASATTILMKVETGHVALLGRLGINIKDASGKIISQDEAIRRLSATYKGQAAAAADTFSGKMKTLSTTAEDVGAKLGEAIVPKVEEVASALSTGISGFEKFNSTLDGVPGKVLAVAAVIPLAAYATVELGKGLKAVGTATETVVKGIGRLLGITGTEATAEEELTVVTETNSAATAANTTAKEANALARRAVVAAAAGSDATALADTAATATNSVVTDTNTAAKTANATAVGANVEAETTSATARAASVATIEAQTAASADQAAVYAALTGTLDTATISTAALTAADTDQIAVWAALTGAVEADALAVRGLAAADLEAAAAADTLATAQAAAAATGTLDAAAGGAAGLGVGAGAAGGLALLGPAAAIAAIPLAGIVLTLHDASSEAKSAKVAVSDFLTSVQTGAQNAADPVAYLVQQQKSLGTKIADTQTQIAAAKKKASDLGVAANEFEQRSNQSTLDKLTRQLNIEKTEYASLTDARKKSDDKTTAAHAAAVQQQSAATLKAIATEKTSVAAHLAWLTSQYGALDGAMLKSEGLSSTALKSIEADLAQSATAVAGAIGGFDDVVGNFGDSKKVSSADISKFLTGQVTAAQHWATNMKTLAHDGLDQGLLEELYKAGPKSAGLVQGLLDSVKKGSVGAVNATIAAGRQVEIDAGKNLAGIEVYGEKTWGSLQNYFASHPATATLTIKTVYEIPKDPLSGKFINPNTKHTVHPGDLDTSGPDTGKAANTVELQAKATSGLAAALAVQSEALKNTGKDSAAYAVATATVKEKQDAFRDSLIQSASTQSGPVKKSILDYLTNIGLIPPVKATAISTPGLSTAAGSVASYKGEVAGIAPNVATAVSTPGITNASAAVGSYAGQLAHLPGQIDTDVHANTAPAFQEIQSFIHSIPGITLSVAGIAKRAAGGLLDPGVPTLVGEGGKPELIQQDAGGKVRVISGPQTHKTLTQVAAGLAAGITGAAPTGSTRTHSAAEQVTFSTPGLAEAEKGVSEYRSELAGLPTVAATAVTADVSPAVRALATLPDTKSVAVSADISQVTAAFAKLPDGKKVTVDVAGLPAATESLTDCTGRLADLPAAKTTVVSASGTERAAEQVADYSAAYKAVPAAAHTTVTADTDDAYRAVTGIRDLTIPAKHVAVAADTKDAAGKLAKLEVPDGKTVAVNLSGLTATTAGLSELSGLVARVPAVKATTVSVSGIDSASKLLHDYSGQYAKLPAVAHTKVTADVSQAAKAISGLGAAKADVAVRAAAEKTNVAGIAPTARQVLPSHASGRTVTVNLTVPVTVTVPAGAHPAQVGSTVIQAINAAVRAGTVVTPEVKAAFAQ